MTLAVIGNIVNGAFLAQGFRGVFIGIRDGFLSIKGTKEEESTLRSLYQMNLRLRVVALDRFRTLCKYFLLNAQPITHPTRLMSKR